MPPTMVEFQDGRRLQVWIEGPADGIPLVFHHGTPSSGPPWEPMVRTITDRGLRYVSWSRPGYGDSTPQPDRTVASVAADTTAVLDQLGAERAYTMGWSGGGPHAIACAALLPDRVIGASTIAAVAPYPAEGLDWLDGMGQENTDEFNASLASPESHTASLDKLWRVFRDVSPEAVADAFGYLVDDVDRGAVTGKFAAFLAGPCTRACARHTAAGTTTTSRSSGRGGSTSAPSAARSTSGRAPTTGWCRSPTAGGWRRTSRPPASTSTRSTAT